MSENMDAMAGAEAIAAKFEPLRRTAEKVAATRESNDSTGSGKKVHELNAWRHHLDQGEKGPKRTLSNLMVHLRWLPDLGKNIRFNEMTGLAEWRGRPIEDTDYVDIQMIVERENFTPVKGDLRPAVARIAKDNSYHPIRDYLDGLAWDGIPRLDEMLPDLFGAPNTAYERMVGSKWMIGAVARVYEPGCKMDNMLVLEGAQNIGKSTALAVLFGREYFGEMICTLKDQQKFMEQSAGRWVLEFAELSALKRADIDYIKALITAQVDASRMSYGHHREDRPRRCVLAATVNPRADMGYLSDPTGNRRFWPVACTRIDLQGLASSRDNLWAEATHRYRNGEPWWLDEKQTLAAAAEQADRLAVDPWAEILLEKLIPGQRYASTEIAQRFLLVSTDRIDQNVKNRISAIMTSIGWVSKPGKDEDRKSVRLWRKEGL